MRILIATNSHDRGSTSRTLEAWARLLPRENVRPTVTVGGGGALLEALRSAGVPSRVRSLRVLPRKVWPFPFLLASARLAATARSTKSALIHVNEHDHHPVAAAAARIARVPLVTHLRFRPGAEYSQWLFRSDRVPDRLFFTSQTQMHDSAAALGPFVPRERWRVLPNGLDFSVFGLNVVSRGPLRSQWSLDDETVAIGTACAISPRKQVDHFVRLVARLRQRGVRVHGFIAGSAHFPQDQRVVQQLHRLAATLGITPYLTFLGYVEPAEPLYHAWDLCVSTSQYETFGMTVLESMACGCPVVTYPGGSVAEIVGDAASVVPDGDEDALYEECLRLAQSPAARRHLGTLGRIHASSRYDIRQIVPCLAQEYRDLLA